jgi:hypothetical protein
MSQWSGQEACVTRSKSSNDLSNHETFLTERTATKTLLTINPIATIKSNKPFSDTKTGRANKNACEIRMTPITHIKTARPIILSEIR